MRRPVLLTFFVESNKTWGKLKIRKMICCNFIAFPRSFPSSEERAENFKTPNGARDSGEVGARGLLVIKWIDKCN